MYSPNTLPQITKSQDNYSLSVYSDTLDPRNAANEVVKLKIAFPNLPPEFYDILLERIKENGFTDKRLKDAINNLIDNFTYSTPTIANIISFDKRIKLYSYNQIIEMVNEYGTLIWQNYKPVKKIGKMRFFASLQDIENYKLEVLQ